MLLSSYEGNLNIGVNKGTQRMIRHPLGFTLIYGMTATKIHIVIRQLLDRHFQL